MVWRRYASRQTFATAIGILFVCAAAWAYLVHLNRGMASVTDEAASMMAMGMRMDGPWSAADILFTLGMWTVMMVAMMGPSAAPMLLLVAKSHGARAGRADDGDAGLPGIVLAFALGYLAVWTGFSAAATLAQWALHDAALMSPALTIAKPRLGALILIAAGAYQMTPLKNACLRHCQSPMAFLMSHWRDGAGGALQMGLQHGVFCLGCCWVLMCILFAVGVMNLVWVAALTAFVLVEKLGRGGGLVSRLGGVALIGVGCIVLARTI